jgi:hypothetical protein
MKKTFIVAAFSAFLASGIPLFADNGQPVSQNQSTIGKLSELNINKIATDDETIELNFNSSGYLDLNLTSKVPMPTGGTCTYTLPDQSCSVTASNCDAAKAGFWQHCMMAIMN